MEKQIHLQENEKQKFSLKILYYFIPIDKECKCHSVSVKARSKWWWLEFFVWNNFKDFQYGSLKNKNRNGMTLTLLINRYKVIQNLKWKFLLFLFFKLPYWKSLKLFHTKNSNHHHLDLALNFNIKQSLMKFNNAFLVLLF
jgi:hypothetical protein